MSVWADVAFDRTMCAAVSRRILVKGITSSRVTPAADAAGAALINASTSWRVMVPLGPEPTTLFGSILFSLINRRTIGDGATAESWFDVVFILSTRARTS